MEQVSETGTSPSLTAWSPKGNFSADGGHFRSDGTPRGTTPPVDVKYGDGRFNYYNTNLYGVDFVPFFACRLTRTPSRYCTIVHRAAAQADEQAARPAPGWLRVLRVVFCESSRSVQHRQLARQGQFSFVERFVRFVELAAAHACE